ncbi:MAG: cytochrome-c oxidase [Geobacteraceae bacterium GWC2_58_44]|nr:MAG: cytochrome-c oxidase [Geobacteraceae bacterium GWC2_58_44]HBG07965.1 SCO family protein [Geobacter sp.]
MGKHIARRLGSQGKLLIAVVMALLLLPQLSVAHVEEDAGKGRNPGSASAREDGVQVGLDERLGAMIPLDTTFRDETGRTLRLGELITGPTIIVPVYYGCTNVCNFLQGGLAQVLPAIRRTPGVDYRVLSVSIDETETPQLAAGSQRMYLAAMNAPFPPGAWRFLTGDAANIRRLTEAAGYRFQRRGRDFMHPVASFVVTGDGKIVRYLYGTSFLSKDVTLALVEAGQGRTGTTIRKVVSYCFSFDPAQKSYQFNLLRVSATVVILCCGGFFAFLVLTGGARKKRKT